MSDEIDQEIMQSIKAGSELMITSLFAHLTVYPIDEKKIDKKTARDNYCKSVLLLWGFIQFHLDDVDDVMFRRIQLISASILFGVLSREEFEPFFAGAGLNKEKNIDHPKLCYEMVKWFDENERLPGVQAIIATGKHLFGLAAFGGKLEDDHIKAFYKMGSLIEEGGMAITVMKSILIDSKIKLYL